jgi:hypothetical protein
MVVASGSERTAVAEAQQGIGGQDGAASWATVVNAAASAAPGGRTAMRLRTSDQPMLPPLPQTVHKPCHEFRAIVHSGRSMPTEDLIVDGSVGYP